MAQLVYCGKQGTRQDTVEGFLIGAGAVRRGGFDDRMVEITLELPHNRSFPAIF